MVILKGHRLKSDNCFGYPSGYFQTFTLTSVSAYRHQSRHGLKIFHNKCVGVPPWIRSPVSGLCPLASKDSIIWDPLLNGSQLSLPMGSLANIGKRKEIGRGICPCSFLALVL